MMTVYVYGCCSIIAGAVSFGIYNLFFAAKNIIHEPEPHYVYLAPNVVDESVPDMWDFQNSANDQNSEEDIGLCLNLYKSQKTPCNVLYLIMRNSIYYHIYI